MFFHLPFGIRRGNFENTSFITKSEYQELMSYARANHIKLEGFKQYNGNITDIIELIDDIMVICNDFPKILEGRRSLVISLDTNSSEDDFATTVGHIVYLNAKLYADINYLSSEYRLAVEQKKFVKNTNYHSVIRHELGHVVANTYGIDTMNIAEGILTGKSQAEIIEFVKNNVSYYAADYSDGREFISECFSAYYSNVAIPFAGKYVEQCKEIARRDF